MQLSTALLCHLGKLTRQNPIWGILTVNEYFPRTSPMRAAFARQARGNFSGNSLSAELTERIFSGDKFAELSKAQQEEVRTLSRSASIVRYRHYSPASMNQSLSTRLHSNRREIPCCHSDRAARSILKTTIASRGAARRSLA